MPCPPQFPQQADKNGQRRRQKEGQVNCHLVLSWEAQLRQDAVVEERCFRCLHWNNAISGFTKVFSNEVCAGIIIIAG